MIKYLTHTFHVTFLLRALILFGLCSISLYAAAAEPLFGVAGVPVDQGITRNYDKIFEDLAKSGVDVFFPTFLYQQAPVVKSLGFESDFGPGCDADQSSFYNLRRYGLQLLIPADSLYSSSRSLPPLDNDPLRSVIACAGSDNVLGVLSYDEPVHMGVSIQAVSALYERVKAVSPGMTVYMVHAPLTLGTPAGSRYLENVRKFSKYADVVGFDIYPVTHTLAKVADPNAPENVLLAGQAVAAYMALIRTLVPDKRYLAVLQNFAYADQFSTDALRQFPRDLVEKDSKGPTLDDTEKMARAALAGGAEIVVWFGGSYTPKSSAPHWKDALQVIQQLAGKE